MIEVAQLSETTRRSVLEVALYMAWADARIDRSELMAISGTAQALGLPLSENELYAIVDRGPLKIGEIDNTSLQGDGVRLAFLTAAWMAEVDDASMPSEASRLQALQEHLDVDAATAAELIATAASLHARFDRSKAWWEEYTALVALTNDTP